MINKKFSSFKLKNTFYFILTTTTAITLLLGSVTPAKADILEPINTNPTLETWADFMPRNGSYALASFWGSDDGSYIWTAANGAVALPDYLGYTLYATSGSLNANMIAGYFTDSGGKYTTFVMENGVVTPVTPSNGSNYYLWGMSENGSALSGSYQDPTFHYNAYYWSKTGGYQDINIPAAIHSQGQAISGDGQTVIVSNLFGDIYTWNGGVHTQLQEIIANATTSADDISYDGSVVVGDYYYFDPLTSTGQSYASRWVNGVHESLGALDPTQSSYASLVSNDGTIVAGQSNTSATTGEAYVWRAGVMTSLGRMGDYSFPMAMTNDGSTVVGFNETIVGLSYVDEPFYWTQADGMQSFAQILADNSVDTTGWDLNNYAGMYITDDGETVYTTGLYNGTSQAYFFRPNGIITPEELVQSLAPAAMPAQQAQAATIGTMAHSMNIARNALPVYLNSPFFTAPPPPAMPQITIADASSPHALQEIAPAAGGPLLSTLRTLPRRATFATGTVGAGVDDEYTAITGNATAGIMTAVGDHSAVGIGVTGSHHSTETRLGGDSTTRTGGANVFMAHENPSRINIYATAAVAAIDITSDRNYINGAAIDSSSGETSGMTYSGGLKIGYEIPVHDRAKIMPYIEGNASYTTIDGYTERGGGFPAIIGDRDDTYLSSHLGMEISHDVSTGLTIRGHGAWGHRYSDEGGIIATSAGLTQYVPDNAAGSDWVEAGIGINKYMTKSAVLAVDLTGRAGSTSEPDLSATVGMVWHWD